MQRDKHVGEDERTIICLAVNPVKYFVTKGAAYRAAYIKSYHIIFQREAYKLSKQFEKFY